MPLDNPGRLSRQQNADVIAFVLKANDWPAGATELPADSAALKQIRIAAVKPSSQAVRVSRIAHDIRRFPRQVPRSVPSHGWQPIRSRRYAH